MMNRKRSGGFTLIELMIVVAIIAILAAVAIPSYSDYVRKGKRADAKAALQGLSQAMEKFYSTNFTYLGAATADADTGAPKATVFGYTKTPREGSGATTYNLTIQAATRNSYSIRATPVGDQENDDCGYLQITQTGARSSGVPAAKDCW